MKRDPTVIPETQETSTVQNEDCGPRVIPETQETGTGSQNQDEDDDGFITVKRFKRIGKEKRRKIMEESVQKIRKLTEDLESGAKSSDSEKFPEDLSPLGKKPII